MRETMACNVQHLKIDYISWVPTSNKYFESNFILQELVVKIVFIKRGMEFIEMLNKSILANDVIYVASRDTRVLDLFNELVVPVHERHPNCFHFKEHSIDRFELKFFENEAEMKLEIKEKESRRAVNESKSLCVLY